MKIIYVLSLILLVSLHANAASFSPYKLSYGEDVILEIDNKGRVVYSKGSSFCEEIKIMMHMILSRLMKSLMKIQKQSVIWIFCVRVISIKLKMNMLFFIECAMWMYRIKI